MKHLTTVFAVLALALATSPWIVAATFTDGAANDNWSDGANWGGSAPASGENVTFNDDGTVDGGVDDVTNIVDDDFTVGKLQYSNMYEFTADGTKVTSQNINTNWHHTQINSTKTLTVQGEFIVGNDTRPNSAAGDAVDDSSDNGNVDTYVKISGDGSFVVNNSSQVLVDPVTWRFAGTRTVLDMSELASADITTKNFYDTTYDTSGDGEQGYTDQIIYFAQDTTITADKIQTSGWGSQDQIHVGETTVLNIDEIRLNYWCEGQTASDLDIALQTGLSDPSFTIRARDGSGRASVHFGNVAQLGTQQVDTNVNLNGADLDILASDFVVGSDFNHKFGEATANSSDAIFSFNEGTIDAQTVYVGALEADSRVSNGEGYCTGTLNIGSDTVDGGTLIADTILLANHEEDLDDSVLNDGPEQGGRVDDTINLKGGTIRATSIEPGVGTDLADVRTFNWDNGTIGNKSGTDLTITQDLILTGTGSHIFDAEGGQSITLNADISESVSGAITKTGAGTLTLSGSNTYSGATTVTAGTLELSHAGSNNISSSSGIAIGSGATLDVTGLDSGNGLFLASGQTLSGSGSVTGPVTVDASASLSPGSSPGQLTMDDLTFEDGSSALFEINGLTPGISFDQVLGTGSELTFNGEWVLNLSFRPATPITDTLTLFDFGTYTPNGFDPTIQIVSGRADSATYNSVDGTLQLVNAVPEPSAIMLISLSVIGLLLRRRCRGVGQGTLRSKISGCAAVVAACLLVGSAHSGAADITYDDGAGDNNWSSNTNWSDDGAGVQTGDNVTFDNTGSDDGTSAVTNTVDSSITIGDLLYRNMYDYTDDGNDVTGQDTDTNWHHTQINDGQTLTVQGAFRVGVDDAPTFPSDPGDDEGDVDTHVIISGDGKLVVNNNTEFNIDPLTDRFNSGSTTILDMRNLAEADITTVDMPLVAVAGTTGHVYFAQDTKVTAENIGMSGWNNARNLYLGEATELYVDRYMLGTAHEYVTPRSMHTISVAMQSGLTSPTVKMRGQNGELDDSDRGDMYLGAVTYSGHTQTTTMNLNGATLDAKFGDFVLCSDYEWGNLNAAGITTFSFNAGTIDATTVKVASLDGSGKAGSATAILNVGSDSVDGGTLIADTIIIGDNNSATDDSDGDGSVNATLNLKGGVIRATSITYGGTGTEAEDVYTFNWDNGTIGNKSGTDLTITQDLVLTGTGSHIFDAEGGQSITLNADISESVSGGITKTGSGTLTLSGSNTHSGATAVTEGTLVLSHAGSNNISSSSGIAIGSGATLDVTGLDSGNGLLLSSGQALSGSGSVTGPVTVDAGASLSPGSSPGQLATDDLTLEGGSSALFEINGLTPGISFDQVLGTGSELTFNGAWTLYLSFRPETPITDTVTLFDFGTYTPNGFDPTIQIVSGRADSATYNAANGTLELVNAVPEPASLVVLGFGALTLLRRRRKLTHIKK
ncbi:MAG: autotransporter-associated beta strand repeat-containing protein [Candidatus Pacebacteria bacterium]|nr:autotransporter-associated beta strand repeat-containing protein [Candidatus Paceibacterota bacterium]